MVVGSGSFGRVFRVTHRLLGTEFVVKRSAHPFNTASARSTWLQVRPRAASSLGFRIQPNSKPVFARSTWLQVRPRASSPLGYSVRLKHEPFANASARTTWLQVRSRAVACSTEPVHPDLILQPANR